MAVLQGAVPTLELEHRLVDAGYQVIAGLDEVGRGSLAGPVVASAVVLPLAERDLPVALAGLRDSKLMTVAARERMFGTIVRVATGIGVGWASHHVIDRDGIAGANRRALLRAVTALRSQPDALLLDHFRLPESPLPQLAISHGDALSLSIAAASVIAKVIRDRWMTKCDDRYPSYGFARHKGYGTAAHRQALQDFGPCALHRRSFLLVAESVR